ncbi:hypothetical protein ACSNN9_26480 [Micromonospora sp. URMC 107]|uniref:hypothetical protein n=1 Tax=Micromonospora sp. URMC 107 TaxID=3423418 RepID=UPI003F1A96DA
MLTGDLRRVLRDGTRQRQVLLVEPLSLVTRSPARRIGYAESLGFARVHEEAHRAHSHLIAVPPAPVRARVALVEAQPRRLAALPPERAEGVPDPAYLT